MHPTADGIYWYREAPGTQRHLVSVLGEECRDLTGLLPRIRGPMYVSKMPGEWIRVDRAIDAATWLMTALGGCGASGEGSWKRKDIGAIFEHAKKTWPEFVP